MVSSRLNVTIGSNLLAMLGLCSSMLNGPRMRPNTPSTSSTTPWCSAGTSSLPVIGGTRGILAPPVIVHVPGEGRDPFLGGPRQLYDGSRPSPGPRLGSG